MKFAGMVALYNPTKENIDLVNNYKKCLDKIYLIDNSDKDNSSLIENDEKIVYIPNCENLGIATALNIAANKAIEDGYKWLLTMDQDSIMTENVLKKLQDYVINNDTSNIGIVSPYHDIGTRPANKDVMVEEMPEVMTSGNLINLDLFQIVGGFKDWLFIDLVDIEYCFNLRKNGYKVLRLNNAVMEHHLGNLKIHKILFKSFVCSNHNSIRRYYMFRNVFYVSDMYKKIYPGYCRYLRKVQYGQIRYVILFEKDKLNKLKMMFKGYRDYKKNIKGKINI